MTRRVVALAVLVILAIGVLVWTRTRDEPHVSACLGRDVLFALPEQVEAPSGRDLEVELVADVPGAIDVIDSPAGPSELWVALRDGRIVSVSTSGAVEELLDISDQVSTEGELGFHSLRLAPDAGALYISYTNLDPATTVEWMRVEEGELDPGERVEVLQLAQPHRWHNGGQLEFGPDGTLYLALGDGGDDFDEPDLGFRAMDPDTWHGALLRLDVSNRAVPGYTVPVGNPFVGGGGAPEVFAYGLRNPWRFTIDASTDHLWIADVGAGCWEEINLVSLADAGGIDFGWPIIEGVRGARGDTARGTPPIHVYGRDDGRVAIVGGIVYRNGPFDELEGAYLFGDLADGALRSLHWDGQTVRTANLGASVPMLVSFHQSADGTLYMVSLQDGIYRVTEKQPT
jgi:glucose/arabinose dehydrogenase